MTEMNGGTRSFNWGRAHRRLEKHALFRATAPHLVDIDGHRIAIARRIGKPPTTLHQIQKFLEGHPYALGDIKDDMVRNIIRDIFTRRYLNKTRPYPPSRFSDGSYPVFYCSEDDLTAVAEILFHRLEDLRKTSTPLDPGYRVGRIWIRFSGQLVNFDTLDEIARGHVDPREWHVCQPIGAHVRGDGFDALSAKSVRRSEGTNLAVFKEDALSGGDILEIVKFEYNSETKSITKVTIDGQDYTYEEIVTTPP